MPGSVRRCCCRDRPGEWDRLGPPLPGPGLPWPSGPAAWGPASAEASVRPKSAAGPRPLCPRGRPVPSRRLCRRRCLRPAVRPASNSALRPGASCSGAGSGPCLPWPFSAGKTAVRVLPWPPYPELGGSTRLKRERVPQELVVLWPGAVLGAAGTCARSSLGILLPRLHKRSNYYSVCNTYRSWVLMEAGDVRSG